MSASFLRTSVPRQRPWLWAWVLGVAVLVTVARAGALLLPELAQRSLAANAIEVARGVLVTAVLMAVAWWDRAPGARPRACWLVLTAAFACWLSGDVAWAVVEESTGSVPALSWIDAPYLAFYALFLVGVLLLPRTRVQRNERTKLLLDSVIVTLGAGVLVWCLLVAEVFRSTISGDCGILTAAMMYPMGDILLIWATMSLFFSRRDPGTDGLCRWAAAGALILIPIDILFGLQSLRGTYEAGNWLGLGWTVGLLLPALGAARRLQLPRVIDGGGFPSSRSWRPTMASLFTAWLFLVAAWLAALFHGISGPTDPVAVVLTIMLALVILRQGVGLADNARLNHRLQTINEELDEHVRQRTAELAQVNAELRADGEELTRAHAALRTSETRLRGLFEADVVGFAFIDQHGMVVDANDRFLRLVVACRTELTQGAIAWSTLVPGASAPLDRAATLKADSVGRSDPVELELAALDGRRLPVLLGRVRLDSGGCDVAVVVDLSERRRLEEGLRQAQRLELLGRVTGGVAHDFNNLLTVIAGYGELLVTTLPPGTPPHRHAAALMDGCNHAQGLVRRLLAVGRGGSGERTEVDLAHTLADMMPLLRQLAGPGIKVEVTLARGPLTALVDTTQLHQLLMNLVVNARDAMPQGGRVAIQLTALDLLPATAATRPGSRAGSFALLTVSDSGCGMSAAVRERLFEPFFTTKAPGCGTGLGLATALSVVRAHDGWIDVDSSPGQGSTFRVALPRLSSGATECATEALPAAAISTEGGPVILLVEDEDDVREVLQMGLEGSGFQVMVAGTAAAALAAAGPATTAITAVVADARLGGDDGRALILRLRQFNPRLAVVLMSGHLEETRSFCRTDPNCVYLAKPFAIAELIEAVRTALERRPG
jgi:two-component system cell cycle sensor histidine kinase/response regulator CckA